MAQPDMVSGTAVPESNWGSYQSQIQNEESEIVAQFLTPYPPYQNEQDNQSSSMFWSDQHTNSYYYSGSLHNLNIYPWSHGDSSNSSSSSNYLATSHPDNFENYYLNEPNLALEMNTISAPVDFNLVDEQNKVKSMIHLVPNPNPSFGDQAMNEENCGENENSSLNESDSSEKRKFLGKFDGVKKKARSSTQVITKIENKQSSKKSKNSTKIGEEDLENNGLINNKQSSSCSSDNDSNENNVSGITSRSSKGNVALNLNGKNRAGRGSATDPQSLYARKRRERINERLRILQNLVPNGTKVDISTMLEEAVQYVKFLQLQIKLLSSDQMWKYAPLAYNGMNIGFDLKISPPQ